MLLLNFSHPFTPEQVSQIEALAGEAITEVREAAPHFDHTISFAGQVKALVDEVGLSPGEWQTRPLLINLPSHNLIAGIFLAELHGRMGHFPGVIRLSPVDDQISRRFVVTEIINLQMVRDRARRRKPDASLPLQATGPALTPSDNREVQNSPMPPPVILPEGITLAHYLFAIEAYQPLKLPPFKGSSLRGGFGDTFKRIVCSRDRLCGQKCELGNKCAYGYIFETMSPKESDRLSTVDEIPRPFVIQAPPDERTFIPVGDNLTFGLTLIGEGIKYLPHFIMVFRELGQIGIGQTRGKYQLVGVDMLHLFEGVYEPIYRAGDEVLRVPQVAVESRQITCYAEALPDDRLTLDFLTPTRLTVAKAPVRQGPPFQILIRTLLSRISSLSYFHCGAALEADFRGLIDAAAAVKLEEVRTEWLERFRRSERQQQHIPIGGLVGRVTYRGDLRPYLPLLALGEFIHVGKGTVFGNGQYRIVRG